jgi:hypothetical protein
MNFNFARTLTINALIVVDYSNIILKIGNDNNETLIFMT